MCRTAQLQNISMILQRKNYFGFDMGQKWGMISERNTDAVYIFTLDVFFKIYYTFSGDNSPGYWLGVECTQSCIESTEASSSEQTIFTGRHILLLACDSRLFYTWHCRLQSQLRAAVSNAAKSSLHRCIGHSLAMWCVQCVVWLAAPHSHGADGDSSHQVHVVFKPCLTNSYTFQAH